MTTYNNLIPQDQSPKSAQQPIKDNFTTFANAFAINHQAMNSIYQGNHTFLVLKVQTTDSIVNPDMGTLFCKSVTNARGASNQVFYKYSSYTGKPENIVQMTYNDIIYTGTQQQTFYLGGYIVYMGKLAVAVSQTSTTVNLTPNSSGLFYASAQANLGVSNRSIKTNIVSTNQVVFTYPSSTQIATLTYLIIGQQ